MPVKKLEIPVPIKRRLLHLRFLSGTETDPVLPGADVRNCMRLLEKPIGDVVLAFLANGDKRTMRMDPRLPMIPSHTKEAHEAGMARGLICLGKLPAHYFGISPAGTDVYLHPTDDADPRHLPLQAWLDEQIAQMTETLRKLDTDEEKGRAFQAVTEEELAAFEPGVELSEDGARTVTHAKFGEGEILRELDGGEKLEIRFGDGSVKTLLARFVQRPDAEN